MRAAIAKSGRLRVDDVDDPIPGPGDVLVRVRACGICGSDLHALVHGERMVEQSVEAGMPATFDPSRDYIMGHEFSAEVLELGPETDGAPVQPGDLVTSIPIVFTPTGIETTAYSNIYNGGYAELMRLSAAMCLKVPNGLDHRRAALTEPMAVGRHAAGKANLQPNDTAVVLGCGPVGLATIADLRRRGVDTIVAADFSPRRRATATAMGATEVVDPRDEPAIDAWRRVTAGMRPLVTFEAIGVPGLIDQAMKAAPAQSRIVIVGVCMQADAVHPFVGISKELNLQFVLGYDPLEFMETLRSIAEGEIDVTPMVTGLCGVDGVPAAFDELASPDEHVKILVEPGGPAAVEPLTL
jgi:threonine dehydrogenase-like Zn-dependent dehydrogenase